MNFEQTKLEPQHYIYVDRECDYGPEIGQAMESAFGEVFGFVGQNGITPISAPISVYPEMDPTKLRFRGGVIVSAGDAATVTGDIKTDVLPSGMVMKGLHTGSYGTLNKTHQALWKHMEAEGLEAAMPVWEVYIDDPGEVDEARLRTEIYRAIG